MVALALLLCALVLAALPPRPCGLRPGLSLRPPASVPRLVATALSAKKKGNKLVSADFLSSVSEQSQELEEIEAKVSPSASDLRKAGRYVSSPEASKLQGRGVIAKDTSRSKPSLRIKLVESPNPGSVRIGLSQVRVGFGDNLVLRNVSFSVSTGERVGLLGYNGAGKTTALKVLCGAFEPEDGHVERSSPDLRVGYLRQEFLEMLNGSRTLEEELLSAFTEEEAVLRGIRAHEDQLEAAAAAGKDLITILDRLASLQAQARLMGAHNLQPRVLKVLSLMGFSDADRSLRVSDFSGGWKMRIGLAKVLTSDPSVLLLDEPTNHYDLESIRWLEEFLRLQSLPMVIVSHDREFLNQVCNKIVFLESGQAITYESATYARFLPLHSERLRTWKERFDRQQRQFADEDAWLKRARNDLAQAHLVKTRQAALERLQNGPQRIPPPPRDPRFRFRFPPAPRSADTVLEVRDLALGFGDAQDLVRDLNWDVHRGDRVAVLGPNGAGKSTLLKAVLGTCQPRHGSAELTGSAKVSYYAQDQADALNGDMTVLEALQDAAENSAGATELRGLLGQFLFRDGAADKKVAVLSGGEKARLALCRLLVRPANVLVLDEPTNHLDTNAREVLEEALRCFAGAVILVSHDRFFLSQVATSLLCLGDGKVERFDGDYRSFLDRRCELRATVEGRYVAGDLDHRIAKARPATMVEKPGRTKNFGGSGVASGDLNKGIKNAKRFVDK